MPDLAPRAVTAGPSALRAYDFGAHLATWEVDDRPVVWCSEHARLDGSAAIRGGIPLCFPWFAAGPDGDLSPSHGPVRITAWHPDDPRDGESLAWRLTSDDLHGIPGAEHFPGPFLLRYAVSLSPVAAQPGSHSLRAVLEVTGTGGEPITVEAALHTYLAVADSTRATVEGLDGCDYLDKVGGERRTQDGPVRIEGETDRVYDRSGPVRLVDPAGERKILVEPRGATQTVVWNPGPEKAAGMADLGDDEWRSFVCVETAATGSRALTVRPGDTVAIGCTVTPSFDDAPGVAR